MATGISYNAKTKTTTIQEIEFIEHVKTAEELEQGYKQRVRELIGGRYDISQEIGLNADNQLAVMAGEAPAQAWVDYRVFVETCKDMAYWEVYGNERT